MEIAFNSYIAGKYLFIYYDLGQNNTLNLNFIHIAASTLHFYRCIYRVYNANLIIYCHIYYHNRENKLPLNIQ